jgi:hypothetical protein
MSRYIIEEKMLKKIFIIIILFFIILPNKLLSYSEVDFKYILFSMLKLSYDETIVFNEHNGISRLSLGLELSRVPHNMYKVDKKKSDFYGSDFNLFEISPGYKFYNNRALSSSIFDFSLLNTHSLAEIDTGIVLGVDFALLDKKTKLYSTKDYHWLSIELEGSYEFFPESNDVSLLPEVFIETGIRTFVPDTVNCPEIKQENRNTKWEFFSGGIKLRTAYKYITFEYLLSAGLMKNASIIEQSLKLFYTFTKYDWFLAGIYLQYNKDAFEIKQTENLSNNKVNSKFESLSFGLFVKPCALFIE